MGWISQIRRRPQVSLTSMAHPDVQDEQRLTPKGRATRDRIVQAAAELIVTEGLAASNMERVRKARTK